MSKTTMKTSVTETTTVTKSSNWTTIHFIHLPFLFKNVTIHCMQDKCGKYGEIPTFCKKQKTLYNKNVTVHLLFRKSILRKDQRNYIEMKKPIIQLLLIFTIVSIVLFLLNTSYISLYTFVGVLWSITIVGISFVIFIENRSPQSTLAWFQYQHFFPLQVCFYTLFSGVAVEKKKHLHRSEEQRKLFREILEGRRLELSPKSH